MCILYLKLCFRTCASRNYLLLSLPPPSFPPSPLLSPSLPPSLLLSLPPSSLLPSLPLSLPPSLSCHRLYGWHFEEWSYDLSTQHVTVSVQSKQLHFHLSVSGEQRLDISGASHSRLSCFGSADIVADRISSTGRVARAVWDLMQTGSTTCALMTS